MSRGVAVKGTKLIEFRGCSHKRVFEFPFPEAGITLWCPDCREERVVAELPDEYKVVCQKPSCEFVRSHKPSFERALRTAHSHRKARNSHEIRIYKGIEPVYYVQGMEEGNLHGRTSRLQLAQEGAAVIHVTQNRIAPIDSDD